MKDNIFDSDKAFTIETLKELKKLILEEQNIKPENKTKIFEMLQEVDFILGKYDTIYEEMVDVFSSMALHDFSKRLPTDIGFKHDFLSFLTLGINMINEQLAENSLSKQGVHKVIDVLENKDRIVFITGINGKIFFANSSAKDLTDFKEESLIGQKIETIIENYCNIEELMLWDGSLNNIPIQFRWNGSLISSVLNVSLIMQSGKVENIIYLIKLNQR